MKPNWFVGFPVPAKNWYGTARRQIPDSLRIFHEDDLHITLAFLGPLPDLPHSETNRFESNVTPQDLILETLLNFNEYSLEITLGKILFLPREKDYTAISFSINSGNDILTDYINRRRPEFFRAAGVGANAREALPHLTVARPPRKMQRAEKQQILTNLQEFIIPEIKIQINKIALYTWSDERPLKQFRIVSDKRLR